MLKVRVIPILTFNGFGLVKTKKFSNPRMVGNPVQAARVYNARGVDELAFIDIFASRQNRKINLKLTRDVINECFMPVSIGGGIETIEDINDLLRIGADKVIIKSKALADSNFIKEAVSFFGSQCISIAVDVQLQGDTYMIYHTPEIYKKASDFILEMQECGVGEFILNSVNQDGMMQGFDIELVQILDDYIKVPVVVVGGGGKPEDFSELFSNSHVEAVGAASIFHFTQYTPLDIKLKLQKAGQPVRVVS